MWNAEITVNVETGEIPSYNDSFTGNYPGFVEFLFRSADIITGSSAADTLLGFAGNDKISGGGGGDNIDGGFGADRVTGGAGNDRIKWGGGDSVNGGGGTDVLRLLSARLNLVPLTNKVLDTEQVDMRGGVSSTLTLGRADVLEMSSTTNNIRIFGDAGDKVDISGSFTRGSVADGFRTYTLGGGALLTVETDVQVF
jgi:Ca2+-binding RTX toxin-like protein